MRTKRTDYLQCQAYKGPCLSNSLVAYPSDFSPLSAVPTGVYKRPGDRDRIGRVGGI